MVAANQGTIRILHQMGRSGGTLIAKCLGSMNDIILLSEVHPMNHVGIDPLTQAYKWFNLFTDEEYQGIKLREEPDFRDIIQIINNKCIECNKFLVLRDWSHADFTGIPFFTDLSYRFTTAEALSNRYSNIQVATTRHPIDQWLSINDQKLLRGKITLPEFMFGYRRFAEECVSIGYLRYEDIVADSQTGIARLCTMLKIPYDPEFISKWPMYKTITGDVNPKRAGSTIAAVPRREVDIGLLTEFEKNSDYQEAIQLLGYHHPH